MEKDYVLMLKNICKRKHRCLIAKKIFKKGNRVHKKKVAYIAGDKAYIRAQNLNKTQDDLNL